MKKIKLLLVFAVCISLQLEAQINNAEYNELMWGNESEEAKVTEVPEKWKDMSAVILYLDESFQYRKQPMNNAINENIFIRKRVKLLDQTAVNRWAEFSSENLREKKWGKNGNYMGIKIIKPNGEIRVIQENDFVELENKESGYTKIKTLKLAVPDLAVGDIIDYYYVSINSYFANVNGGLDVQFEPELIILQSEYPILYRKLSIQPERRTYLNAKSYNGAPEPELVEDGKWTNYTYISREVESFNIDQMVFPYRAYPTIVYQVTMCSDANRKKRLDFLGDEKSIKSNVSENEIASLLLNFTDASFQKNTYAIDMKNECARKIKPNLSANPTDLEVAENAFYYFRHYLNFKYSLYYGQLAPMSYFMSDFEIIIAFSNVLSDFGVNHELGIAADRQYSSLDEVVISTQLIPFVRLYNQDSTLITVPAGNTVFGEHIFLIEGTTALTIDKKTASAINVASVWNNKTDDLFPYQKKFIPVSTTEENSVIDSIFINLENLSPAKVSFSETFCMMGEPKYYYSQLIIPFSYKYIEEADSYAMYNTFSPADTKQIMKNIESIENLKDKEYAERHDMVKLILNESQNVDDVVLDTVNLLSPGRWTNDDTLKFQYKFTITSGIKKAGNSYIIEIGKFIGRNKEFTKEEKNRKVPVFDDTPHSHNWILSLNIPEDYKVEGIGDLEISVDNSSGSFTCHPKLEDNLLILDIQKVYKKNYYPIEEWPQVLEFLQAAVEFTQKQILISKSN
ncbi:MAG TPA: DUF3857 domain-containing protein [Bacteroidales bacterium]